MCVCVRMAWWASCGYTSLCLPSADSEGEDVDEEEEGDVSSVNSTDSDDTAIRYVLGDVTHPQAEREDVIIIQCVGMFKKKTKTKQKTPAKTTGIVIATMPMMSDELSVEFKQPKGYMCKIFCPFVTHNVSRFIIVPLYRDRISKE